MRLDTATSAALIAVFFLGSQAHAQGEGPDAEPRPDSQTPAAPRIEPPEPTATPIAYPNGATGDAAVVLQLTIDPDGNVTQAQAIEGPEPFATAAETAAQRWRFLPARSGDRAVSARIHFRVQFTEQRPLPSEAADATPMPVPSARPEEPQQLEVVVYGEQREPGAVTITSEEGRQLPGALGDPLRAIEALPGVIPVASGLPYFFVRGAPPGHVGYFFDGIRLPQLYHLGIVSSNIHPGLIERVDLYRGGYPARYGRFAGGIVTAERVRPRHELHGEASIRLFDAGGMIEAPFASGRGTSVLAGRYSYTGLVLSLFSDADLRYWDYQGLVSYDVSPDDTVSLLAFGAYDFLAAARSDLTEDVAAETMFHRLDLRYRHAFGASDSWLQLAATLGVDETTIPDGEVSDRLYGVRSELAHRLGRGALLRTGADVNLDRFSLQIDDPLADVRDAEELFPSRTELVFGAYADVVLSPEAWFSVTPGLRVDRFASRGRALVAIDPRLAAQFAVHRNVRILHAFGIAHQSADFVPNVPAARVESTRGALQTAVQASSGVEVDLPEQLMASVTAFDNVILNLSDPLGIANRARPDPDFADRRALGSAVGLEFLLHRPLTSRFGGMLSYTLSRATRSYGRIQSLSAFDRSHVLNLSVAYDLGYDWRASSRLVFFTGTPTETTTSEGPRFISERARPFYRADVRLEKRWVFGERRHFSVVFEVINATLSREVLRRECNTNGCVERPIGPVTLPSIGVEAAF